MIIDKKEALRYLGYKGVEIDRNTGILLEECIREIKSISKPRETYDIFSIEKDSSGILVKDTNLALTGKSINKHLINSGKIAIIAATLGIEIDRHIALYSKTDLTKALIFDACASTAIEWVCDELQNKIKSLGEDDGYRITNRFSPGYGDFPMTVQKDISKVLKTYERIGLSVNENHLMIPRKSVTAIIGFQREKLQEESNVCDTCGQKDCIYRRDGE